MRVGLLGALVGLGACTPTAPSHGVAPSHGTAATGSAVAARPSAVPSASAPSSAGSAGPAEAPAPDGLALPPSLSGEAVFIFNDGEERIDVWLSFEPSKWYREHIRSTIKDRNLRQVAHGPVTLADDAGESVTVQHCEGCMVPIWQRAASDKILVSLDRTKKHEGLFEPIVRSFSRHPALPSAPGTRRIRALGISFDVPISFALVAASFKGPRDTHARGSWTKPWKPCADEMLAQRLVGLPKIGMTIEPHGRHESVRNGVPFVDVSYSQSGGALADDRRIWFIHSGPLGNGGLCLDAGSTLDADRPTEPSPVGLDTDALLRLASDLVVMLRP